MVHPRTRRPPGSLPFPGGSSDRGQGQAPRSRDKSIGRRARTIRERFLQRFEAARCVVHPAERIDRSGPLLAIAATSGPMRKRVSFGSPSHPRPPGSQPLPGGSRDRKQGRAPRSRDRSIGRRARSGQARGHQRRAGRLPRACPGRPRPGIGARSAQTAAAPAAAAIWATALVPAAAQWTPCVYRQRFRGCRQGGGSGPQTSASPPAGAVHRPTVGDDGTRVCVQLVGPLDGGRPLCLVGAGHRCRWTRAAVVTEQCQRKGDADRIRCYADRLEEPCLVRECAGGGAGGCEFGPIVCDMLKKSAGSGAE